MQNRKRTGNIEQVDVPLMLINAIDDPIAYLGRGAGELNLPSALHSNEKLCLVLTQEGVNTCPLLSPRPHEHASAHRNV